MQNRKTRVLFFTSRFPRWQGDSVCNFVYYLARELTKYYDVFVLAPHDNKAHHVEIMEGMHVRRFSYFFPRKFQRLSNEHGLMANIQSSWIGKLQVLPFMLTEIISLLWIVKKEAIDVVNSHWMVPQGFIAAAVQKIISFYHLVTIHAGDIFALRRWPAGKLITRFIANNTDSFLPVSQFNYQTLTDLIGHPANGKVLPMGVDSTFFVPQEDKNQLRAKLDIPFERVILFVGRLSEKKGIKYLIRGFQMSQKHLKDVGLVVVGTGPLEQNLFKEAKNLALENSIMFAGSKNHEELQEFYAAADLSVVPSIVDSKGDTEGMPVVVLEALSSGLPVLATNVGGIPDVIKDGFNGYLVEQKNSEAIAAALTNFFTNSNSMSENALQTARQYDWTNIGFEYKKIIDATIQNKF